MENKPNDAVLYNAIILAQASLRQGTHKQKQEVKYQVEEENLTVKRNW